MGVDNDISNQISNEEHLSLIKLIADKCEKNLNSLKIKLDANPNWVNATCPNHDLYLLAYAFLQRNFEAVTILLERGAIVKFEKYLHFPNALFLAFGTDAPPQIIDLLIERIGFDISKSGFNINQLNDNGCTVLNYALKYNKTEQMRIISILIENGADPFINHCRCSAFRAALSHMHDLEFISILVSKSEHMKILYTSVIQNKSNKIKEYFDRTFYFSQDQLEVMFLFAMGNKFFDAAQAILQNLQRVFYLKGSNILPIIHMPTSAKMDKFEFPEGYTKTNAFIHAFKDIANLLEQPEKCIELLKTLDQEIELYQKKLDYDFSQIKAEPMLLSHNACVPKAPSDNITLPKETHGLLRFLIRQKLQKFHIEEQNELYTFCGFVNQRDANNLIRNGCLFKEQYFCGNALFHGLYSHYLQWYIIARAIEDKVIKLKDGITLRKLLSAFVDATYQNDSAWVILIDQARGGLDKYSMGSDNIDIDFHSPAQLTITLLLCDELPHLRGYLTQSSWKAIQKILKLFKTPPPSYECVVAAGALANEFFGYCHIINTLRARQYYQTTAKTRTVVSGYMESNILAKDAGKRYKVASQLFTVPATIEHNPFAKELDCPKGHRLTAL